MSKKFESKTGRQRRKRKGWGPLLLGIGGLALLLLAALALRNSGGPKAAIEVNGAPGLKVDQELIDLGDVKVNQMVEASFTITNVGDQPLRIEEQPYIEVVEGC